MSVCLCVYANEGLMAAQPRQIAGYECQMLFDDARATIEED